MLSKLSALKFLRFYAVPVRKLGGLSTLERYEKLRQLCCTSEVFKRKQEIEYQLRPKTLEVEECEERTCCDCIGNRPRELLDINCKTAMVLGGASGIGLETAENLLKYGAGRVIIGDFDQTKGIKAVKKLCAAYGNDKAFFLLTDIRQQPSLEMAFSEVYSRFKQVEIYVNTVGVYDETPQCWDKMIETNLMGCVRGTILAYEYLSTNTPDECNQNSVVINVTSYGSLSAVPSMPMFSSASNGIVGLTSSFGQDFHFKRSKIRFVTVCPTCTDSGALKNMHNKHYDRLWAGHSTHAMKCCNKQSSKVVGVAIVNAAKHGINGSVYVIKEGKYYRYAMPDYPKYMRQETILS